MPLLVLDGQPFSAGRAKYLDAPPTAEGRSARVHVKIGLAGIEGPVLAMLDTGAEWSVLEPEIAEALGLLDGEAETKTLSTRLGNISGRLVRTTLTLLADEGTALDVDAIVFVPTAEWPSGGNFLGYSGLLERIRLGLDPQANDVYFAGY